MEILSFADLRPRTVWDLVDDAFDLYRERFASLAALAAVAFVPAHILYSLLTTRAYERLQEVAGRSSDDMIPGLLVYVAASLAGLPLLHAAQGLQSAATASVVEAALQLRTVAATDVVKCVLRQAFPLLAGCAAILVLNVAAGLPTLGLGSLFVLVCTAFVTPCLALERNGLRAAFRRSWALTTSAPGRVLGLLLLMWAMTTLMEIGVTGLISLIFALVPAGAPDAKEGRDLQEFILSQTASAAGSLLLAPLSSIAMCLLYFDQRVRREGLDLEIRARRSRIALAPDAFGGIGGGAPLPGSEDGA